MKKTIILILTIIIICSIILIIKITNTEQNDYDEYLYNEIYSEFDWNFNSDIETASESKINTTYNKDNTESTNSKVIASIKIPKIDIEYPVIYETTEEYLKIAPCKFAGNEPNTYGNFSIIGHNYKNSKFFSRLHMLNAGDEVILKSLDKREIKYKVYDKFEVVDDDFSCIDTSTNGTIELTLITCTDNKEKRYVVKCKADI